MSSVVKFEPYQGAKKGKQIPSSTNWRLGKNILRLMGCLPPMVSYQIFMDNYLTHFEVNKIRGVLHKNTLREDIFAKPTSFAKLIFAIRQLI